MALDRRARETGDFAKLWWTTIELRSLRVF
jgi:hypothetical protein